MDISKDVLKVFESASEIALGSSHTTSHQERKKAEEFLLSFRKSKFPYKVCKDILEISENQFALFQAATTLKEAIIREWNILDHETKVSLQEFVFNYLSSKPNIVPFVRKSLCIVLALMLKYSTFENNDYPHRISFYKHLASMLSSRNSPLEEVACSILSAICSEFSASDRSTTVGLSVDQHNLCKKIFEENDLMYIFSFLLEMLHFVESSIDTEIGNYEIGLCKQVLPVAEEILSWEFVSNNFGKEVNFTSTSSEHSSAWSSVLLDPRLVQLFFKLLVKLPHQGFICETSINCLTQLAALNLGLFSCSKQKSLFMDKFVHGFMHAFSSGKLQQHEVLGLANIFNNLTCQNKLITWAKEQEKKDVFLSFLQLATQFICMFITEAVNQENQGFVDEGKIFLEASELMLDGFTNIGNYLYDNGERSVLANSAISIITSFLQSRLSPPDGIRKSVCEEEESDIDELEENDIDRYYWQLMKVATVGRYSCQNVLPTMCRVLESQITSLESQVQSVSSCNTKDKNTCFTNAWNDIYENLHWLLLISGHILADQFEEENPRMPTQIIDYSISQKEKVNEAFTLQVLTLPKEKFDENAGSANSVDNVVRLVSTIVKLCDFETNFIKSYSVSMWSPQLSQDILWFVKHWVDAYLCFDETYYQEFSPVFSSSFGRDSEGAKWLICFIASKIVNTFTFWTSENDVLLEACNLLHLLVDHSERCKVLSEYEEFWTFCKNFCSNVTPFNCISDSVKQNVVSSIVLLGSAKMNLYKDAYWKETLEPIKSQYRSLISKEWFLKIALEDKTRQDMSSFLTLIQGVAKASKPENSSFLFTYLADVLQDCPNLFNIYHNFQDVSLSILEFFAEIAYKQICYLEKSQSRQFYLWTMHLLQIYQKHNTGKRSLDDEETIQDITLVIELLSHLLADNFISFQTENDVPDAMFSGNGGNNLPNSADVVMYGMSIILPFVTSQSLLYPSFSSQYYKLVTFVCELFPERIEKLPDGLRKFFIQSIYVGLDSCGPDNAKLCLEAIEGVATHCLKTKESPSWIHNVVLSFIRMVFDCLIFNSGDADLLQSAGGTFFVLLCYQPQLVTNMMRHIIESQSDSTYKQKLTEAFQKLVPDVNDIVFDRSHRVTFLKSLEKVVVMMRSILCVK